jgi:metallo-beta-lactamase family protein
MSTTSGSSLRFLGATGTVTGSRYLLEHDDTRVLIDCGLFQGYKELRERNRLDFPVNPESIDAVVLSHAHLDHSGYVPALVRDGFAGNIITTTGTAELCSLLLPDSAHLLEEEAERAARKGYSKHDKPTPLYSTDDAEKALTRFRTSDFDVEMEVAPGVRVTFIPAGHILGAAQVRVTIGGKIVHFTGDLGRKDDALMLPPRGYAGSNILVTESTYGDRSHPHVDPMLELQPVLDKVLKRGGVVVIPAFAVGRSQSLLLHISRLMKAGSIPNVPVYLNSPMAVNATHMYEHHRDEHRIDSAEFHDMYNIAHLVNSVEESKALNERHGPMIIVAASGMMTGGRVLHHVVAFGQDEKNAIFLSGYQAGGTRGALLAAGERSLRIFGHDVPIRAEVIELQSMSGHADADQIIEWMRSAPTPPEHVFVTHGEPMSADRMRFRIADELKWNARVPHDGEEVAI